MMFRPGDVVLIPFPFSDHQATKKRPVLVLKDPDRFDDMVCLAITSNGHHTDGFLLDASSFSEGILPKTSWVRVGKAYSLNQSMIVGTFGSLHNAVFQAVQKQFCRHFGCQPQK
jgi:mRNA interferase MazF